MPGFKPERATRDRFVVRDLGVGFRTPSGVVPVVSGLSLEAAPGKIIGVAGESGSGKTTAVLAAIGYQPPSAVRLDGESHLGDIAIFTFSPEERRRLWAKRISYVAQDAAGSLNPAFRIGTQLREVLEVNLAASPLSRRAAEPGNSSRLSGSLTRRRCSIAILTSAPAANCSGSPSPWPSPVPRT